MPTTALSEETEVPSTPMPVLRDLKPGDIGWVIERHGKIYADEYGWNEQFEALVAETAAAYLRRHDPHCENAWIAEIDGRRVGSVFLVRIDEATAKLRLLLVESDARGAGIGRALVQATIDLARAAGYTRMILWTNDVLTAARNLYESFGFQMIHSEPNHEFGPATMAETWELLL